MWLKEYHPLPNARVRQGSFIYPTQLIYVNDLITSPLIQFTVADYNSLQSAKYEIQLQGNCLSHP